MTHWLGADFDGDEDGDGALLGAVNQHTLDIVDILNDPCHEVTRGALIEVVDGEPLEFAKDIAAHVVDHVLLKVIIDADAQAIEHITQQECAG
mgnify:CR=1 FL=1